jgi:hypothetical protein
LSAESQNLEAEVQMELAKLVSILRRVKRVIGSTKTQTNPQALNELETLTSNVIFAIDALYDNPSEVLAINIRKDAEQVIRRIESPLIGGLLNKISEFLGASSTQVKILLGLTLALPLYVAIPSSMIFLLESAAVSLENSGLISYDESARQSDEPEIYIKDFQESAALIILSFISGSTGSIISILSRVGEYSSSEHEQKFNDAFLPIFIGLFKPIIGGTFGIMAFAVMSTSFLREDILEQPRTDAKWFTVIAITFVTGFSERLAKDIIGQVENKLSTSGADTDVVSSGLKRDQNRSGTIPDPLPTQTPYAPPYPMPQPNPNTENFPLGQGGMALETRPTPNFPTTSGSGPGYGSGYAGYGQDPIGTSRPMPSEHMSNQNPQPGSQSQLQSPRFNHGAPNHGAPQNSIQNSMPLFVDAPILDEETGRPLG